MVSEVSLVRVPLQSSLLAWVRYHAASARLEVQFHSGERYRYFTVPQPTYQQLLQASSHGAFFNHRIRNRFPYQHLSKPSTPVVLPATRKTK